MFKGKRHYNEFLAGEEKVSTSVLRDRLQALLQTGIISKGADEVKKSRIRYSLTEKGIDLLPILVNMIEWSDSYDKDTAADQEFLYDLKADREQFLDNLKIEIRNEHLV